MQTVKTLFILYLLFLLSPVLVVSTALAAETPPQAGKVIKPADVFTHTLWLRQELVLITSTMGETHDDRPEITVRDVQPREVFLQALTLFRRSNQLCYEFTRESLPAPRPPQRDIRPRHVFAVVAAAAERLACVKEVLQISAHVQEPPVDEAKTLVDVFTSIVQAKRQLYVLLAHRISHTSIFAQVQLANHYTAEVIEVLERFGEDAREPTMPLSQPGKRLVDVYQRLVACYALIQQIAQASGLRVLELEPQTDMAILPGDVYDMAALIVSQVRYFATLTGMTPPHTPPRLTRKLPSHVYRRAQWLEAQLHELHRLVQLYPNWHALQP